MWERNSWEIHIGPILLMIYGAISVQYWYKIQTLLFRATYERVTCLYHSHPERRPPLTERAWDAAASVSPGELVISAPVIFPVIVPMSVVVCFIIYFVFDSAPWWTWCMRMDRGWCGMFSTCKLSRFFEYWSRHCDTPYWTKYLLFLLLFLHTFKGAYWQ